MSRSYWDWGTILLNGFIGALSLAFVLILGAVLTEAVQSYRSFDARVACEATRMVPRRQDFSTAVVCVPVPTRQDTLTLGRP